MLLEFLRFELYYRRKRTSTYAYAIIIFLITFFIICSPKLNITGADGQIKANAPFVITYIILVLTFVFTMVTSAISGVTIVRDFDHQMEPILFSTQLSKFGYLFGRFLGVFIILIVINSVIILGLFLGYIVGKELPWDVSWKFKELLPIQWNDYLIPFFVFTIPNIFISASLFFMSGALGRKAIVIYTQGVVLVILYQLAFSLLRNLESQYIAALIDPFGVQTFLYVSKYWTSVEQNTLNVSLQGVLLYNRLIWIGIGIIALLFTYYRFSFSIKSNGASKNTIPLPTKPLLNHPPFLRLQEPGWMTRIVQVGKQAWLYVKMISKEVPFLAIIICGIIVLIIKAFKVNEIYGTSSFPTTFSILSLLSSFDLFFLIIVIFYSGELMWKDRSVNFHLILDSLPISSAVNLLSKFFALLIIYILLLLILIACGVIVQASFGYYKFEPSIYFGTLYTSTLSFLTLYTLFSFFVQGLVNNKFHGFVICIVCYIVNASLNQFGIEHDLWRFASGTLGIYSDMNHYGHFIQPFSWLRFYWLSFSIVLFIIATIFYTRGSDITFSSRWKKGKSRARFLLIYLSAFLILFLSSGFYIYYNTAVLNHFQTTNEILQTRADYEIELKRYETFQQPKITVINIKTELYPYDRYLLAEGYYILKNKSEQPIDRIHIQHNWNNKLSIDYLSFDRDATLIKEYTKFRYSIYHLVQPLQPSDSLKLKFKVSLVTEGFKESEDTDLVFNGTFISNEIFPAIGYLQKYELTAMSDRNFYHLPPQTSYGDPVDSLTRLTNVFGNDADQVQFEMQISTAKDQIALAPGTLQREWLEDNRRYFHYRMERPMNNVYSFLSGRYALKEMEYEGVNLQIFYHPAHAYNLERMMQSMKDAIHYYSKAFGPYLYQQLRIVEFPRYTSFANSYPTTIPFSEGAGFILKVDNPLKDLEVPYYITAREVAHQWWGQQVTPARAKGSSVISEGLAQYAALMTMKKNLPIDQLERYLKYEQDNYLKGRFSEKQKEPPLILSETQDYIVQNKSSIVFFALQNYLGQDVVDSALQKFYNKWIGLAAHPTVYDLVSEVKHVTPDTLQYLVHDMFETITLFENETEDAAYQKNRDNTFTLTLKFRTRKLQADSVGRESIIPINDWIDIGVYGGDNLSNQRLIYLQKHKFNSGEQTITLNLNERPFRAGIDPFHTLMDRHLIDNIIKTEEIIPIAISQ